MEEAAAIKSVNVKVKLEGEGQEGSKNVVTVHLVTLLQDEQDHEAATLIRKLHILVCKRAKCYISSFLEICLIIAVYNDIQSEEEMKRIREYEINQRHWQVAENVLKVLTQYDGSAEDDLLLEVSFRRNCYW